jgi:guanine deaminase
LIFSGHLLLADSGRCFVEPGVLRIEEGRIAEIQLGEIATRPDVGGNLCLIAPGFVDTHLHLPQFDCIGSHGSPLLDWLDAVVLPTESRWVDSTLAQAKTERAIHRMLRSGTTGFAAYATVHHHSAVAALELAQQRGVRAWIGQTLMDVPKDAPLRMETNRLLDETHRSLELFPSGGRVAAAITPRYALGCSEQLMKGCAKLAQETNALVQTHLAENVDECAAVFERFGKEYLEVYDSMGLVRSGTIFGHGIHLGEAAMMRLAESSSIVAHCPTANDFLNSGIMRREALTRAQVQISLGSDIGAGYEVSMVRVARAMIQAAVRLGTSFPDASEAFFAITSGNAQSLGWNDSGQLLEGAIADLVVIQPFENWLATTVDPLSQLLFSWNDCWIRSVWLRGRRVV